LMIWWYDRSFKGSHKDTKALRDAKVWGWRKRKHS
jgi:hypothetical protein